MTYQTSNFYNVENVGPLDRVNRIIAGTTLIMVAVLFTAITPAAIAGLVALGTYAGLTGFIGWDPLYSATKASQQLAPAPLPATIANLEPRETKPSGDDYQKAA
jgi:hypothetical protein